MVLTLSFGKFHPSHRAYSPLYSLSLNEEKISRNMRLKSYQVIFFTVPKFPPMLIRYTFSSSAEQAVRADAGSL